MIGHVGVRRAVTAEDSMLVSMTMKNITTDDIYDYG